MKVERVIVLSWIQNLLKILKKEEEENSNDLHMEKRELPPLSREEGGKELETRISYQYPKGTLSNSLPQKETKKNTEQATLKRREQRHPEKSQPKRSVPKTTVKADLPKAKKETPPKIRGPFQPTEIPSPVFGFNRPKPSDPLIEHELSHFEIVSQIAPVTVNRKVEEVDKAIGEFETNINSRIDSPVENQPEEETLILKNQPEVVSILHEEEHIDVSEELPPAEEEKVIIDMDKHETIQMEDSIAEETNEQLREKDEQQEPITSSKTHLPFNVMMLKQDKLKWEESKKSRREAQSFIQQPSAERDSVERHPVEQHSVERHPVEQPKPLAGKNEEAPIVQSNQAMPERKIEAAAGLYDFPVSSLLNPPVLVENDGEWLQLQEELLNQTLQNFNVGASVVHVTQGPSVTRFEVQPEPGVKVNKITNLSDDIKLSLAARDIRIEAPIPGKHTIGIEVPNQTSRPVFINEIISSSVFHDSASPLTAVLGLDISGKPIVTDLKKMPHGLIAGATGSGKSVCINSILVSLLFKASPEDLKLLLIDPKMVELAPYNHIPHLVSPVITDVKAATAALKWAVEEMERRYELFAHTGVRDINRFNELAIQHKQYSDKLPFIVIIIDELADLMMMSPADVEEAICRIAQKARACGIHLIVATQRPSVDVITGLIKANIPTRIAFSVSSQIDSRTIIDISGAEKLLGRGDMLFLENGSSKPVRLQGTYVSDEEIDLVVAHVREQREPEYLFQQEELLKKAQVTEEEDELFYEACEFIIDQGGASTSSLQRRFKIGYNRAARLMDMLESQGFISGANGSKPREVLISEADLESIQEAGQ